MTRTFFIAGLIVIGLIAAVFAMLWHLPTDTLCATGDACVREWMSATSGWAAVMAAIPTILYLSRQVRDADRHQKTNFAIQLRRQRILATRVAQIAQAVLDLTAEHEKATYPGNVPDIRHWNRETVENIIEVLRQETLTAFENEIAFPSGLSARTMSNVVTVGLTGATPKCQSAPTLVRVFFKDMQTQALEYLVEVERITKAS